MATRPRRTGLPARAGLDVGPVSGAPEVIVIPSDEPPQEQDEHPNGDPGNHRVPAKTIFAASMCSWVTS